MIKGKDFDNFELGDIVTFERVQSNGVRQLCKGIIIAFFKSSVPESTFFRALIERTHICRTTSTPVLWMEDHKYFQCENYYSIPAQHIICKGDISDVNN
jgi:hypothetical protein